MLLTSPQRPRSDLLRRTRQVQRQQPFEQFVVGHVGAVVGLAIRSGHRHVQRVMRCRQPGWTLVVQLGQRAPG